MTKFADQLYDDLMREHGPALAALAPRPEAREHRFTPRRAVLTGGVGLAAAGAVAGTLVTVGGAAPAYAATANPDGTVNLAVYTDSGYAQANDWLRKAGDGQVVVVPVKAGCPSPESLPKPPVPPKGIIKFGVRHTPSRSGGEGVIVSAQGIPAGDILVVGIGTKITARSMTAGSVLTGPPAPKCLSLPPVPPPGSGHVSHGSGPGQSSSGES